MSVIEVCVGTRPNAVKAAALWRAHRRRGAGPPLSLVHSGQHYSPMMAADFASELGLPRPAVQLHVSRASTHGAQTAGVLERYERHLLQAATRPRAAVVIGDVNSTLGFALAAAKLGVPVVHLEAGLRSFDRTMPEELNRIAVDAISDLLLASERSGLDNLQREGVDSERVVFTGSLTVDALLHELPLARELGRPVALGLEPRGYALVTLHRPANVDDAIRLERLVGALIEVSGQIPIAFAMHPRTRRRLQDAGLSERLERAARVLSPQPYRDAVALMHDAAVVITDSGGMQEETTALGVPCLTLRNNTERPATVEHGTNTLVGEDPSVLPRLVAETIDRPRRAVEVERWDGWAAGRAVDALLAAFG